MIRIIGIIAAVVAVPVAAVLIYAATLPDRFQVERTTSIKAPPEAIFALISDFRRYQAWSPYEKLDPAMKRSFSGPAGGKGAVYAWESDGRAGSGQMEITDLSPPFEVSIALDFTKPFETHNTVELTLIPEGDATKVTWAMHGPMPYIAKLMSSFFSMDAMIGKDFEAGLANLKALAES